MRFKIAIYLNRVGHFFLYQSSKLARREVHVLKDSFVERRYALHKLVRKIRSASKVYFGGLPYQSLDFMGIFGDRSSEDRFDEYGLDSYVNKEDVILDLGCSQGFLLLYTCPRT